MDRVELVVGAAVAVKELHPDGVTAFERFEVESIDLGDPEVAVVRLQHVSRPVQMLLLVARDV